MSLPLLVVTRPAAASARFAHDVQAALGHQVQFLLAPLQRIDPVKARMPDRVAAVIFSSQNAVWQALNMGLTAGTKAYCVGDQTAETARTCGFDAVSASGNADDLVALVLSDPPRGPVLHLRGQESRGDIAARLGAAGLDCESLVCYEQVALPPDRKLVEALTGQQRLVLPLFSPNSAAILVGAGIAVKAPIQVVAMSKAVAIAAAGLATLSMDIADRPDSQAMVNACCKRLMAD